MLSEHPQGDCLWEVLLIHMLDTASVLETQEFKDRKGADGTEDLHTLGEAKSSCQLPPHPAARKAAGIVLGSLSHSRALNTCW